jgi:hypothetical protein
MADETRAGFAVPGAPGPFLAAFKAAPPQFLVDGGYRLVDESYESLVYEANVTTTPMKLFSWGFAKTLYRLSFTFRDVSPGPDGQATTAVTVIGQAKAPVRAAIAGYVAEAGQI